MHTYDSRTTQYNDMQSYPGTGTVGFAKSTGRRSPRLTGIVIQYASTKYAGVFHATKGRQSTYLIMTSRYVVVVVVGRNRNVR